MTLALPLALSLLLSAPPAPAPAIDWSRIPERWGSRRSPLRRRRCWRGCSPTSSATAGAHTPCSAASTSTRSASTRRGWRRWRRAWPGWALSSGEILKTLTEYYASFDRTKRARLEVTALGKPLGDAKAPVTLHEFADFECPFCQQLRPKLEDFVKRYPGRVKLVFRPFPIPGHPHADTAAEASEWARDQDIFWPFHDAMFNDPKALDTESLVSLAGRLGKDGESLRKALADRKYRERVQSGLIEGRRAGVVGTPTLFINGRRHVIPDYSDTVLEFILEDEEQWMKNGWKD